MCDNNSPFGEVVFSYSRAQAIEDGVLVDLTTQFPVVRQHFKFHLACTATVWDSIQDAVHNHMADHSGVLHDICTMAKLAIRRGHGTDTVLFSCIIGATHKSLKMHCGPGDTKNPVLTLMLPSED